MTSLRDKLARLGPQPTPGAGASASEQGPDAAGAAAEEDHTAMRLAELRSHLESLVGPAPASAASRSTRPPIEETHQTRVDPDTRVGAVPVGAALGADASMLSLLALTPALASCDLRRCLFFDTETTGLGGAGSVAFLVGLCWYEAADQRFVFERHFLRELHDEIALLRRVAVRFEAASLVASYNGKSFDLPLLQSRMVMCQLPPLPPRPHLDLLHLVRRLHVHRDWSKTLRTVERQVLRFDRGPDVSGADIAARYFHYLHTGDDEGLRAVVDHNVHDVLSLVALVGLYGEPWDSLAPVELAAAARVMRRAGDLDRALAAAHQAVAERGGPHALRARAEIAKARGDKWQALADFEALTDQIDDPAARLELAKLYEHHVRAPARALEVIDLGTSEGPNQHAHREARLQRKIAKAKA